MIPLFLDDDSELDFGEHFNNYMEEWLLKLKGFPRYKSQRGILTQIHRNKIKKYVRKILTKNKGHREDALKELDEFSGKLCSGDENDKGVHWLRFGGSKKLIKQLKKDLEKEVISRVKRKIDDLLDSCSTNPVESGNSTLTTRGKKLTDDSRTGSALYKASGGVVLHNDGPLYISDIKDRLEIPKTERAERHFQRKQLDREKRSARKKTKEFKARRVASKVKRNKSLQTHEKTGKVSYLHGVAFEKKKKKFEAFDPEDEKQYAYGLPQKTHASRRKKRKRMVDEEADLTFPLKNFEFDLFYPPKKRRKKNVKMTVVDIEHCGGKKKDNDSFEILQIGAFDIETGTLDDFVVDETEILKMPDMIRNVFLPKVRKSKEKPLSKIQVLDNFLDSLLMKENGKKFEHSFVFGADGKNVDFYGIKKEIERIPDKKVRNQLLKKYKKLIKIDIFALIGRNSVDSQIELFRLGRKPIPLYMNQLKEKLNFSMEDDDEILPVDDIQHNGCFDAYVEGMGLLQVFSNRQLHDITKKSLSIIKNNEPIGGTLANRKKLKTTEYASYFGKLREEGLRM